MSANLSRKHWNQSIVSDVVRITEGALGSGNPKLHLTMTLDFLRVELANEPRYFTALHEALLLHAERRELLD
jgi:hypothetical protein